MAEEPEGYPYYEYNILTAEGVGAPWVRGNFSGSSWSENPSGRYLIKEGYIEYRPSAFASRYPDDIGQCDEASQVLTTTPRTGGRYFPAYWLHIAAQVEDGEAGTITISMRSMEQWEWDGIDYPDQDNLQTSLFGLIVDDPGKDIVVQQASFLEYAWAKTFSEFPIGWSLTADGETIIANTTGDDGVIVDVFGNPLDLTNPSDLGQLQTPGKYFLVLPGQGAGSIDMPGSANDADGMIVKTAVSPVCATLPEGVYSSPNVYVVATWWVHVIVARLIVTPEMAPSLYTGAVSATMGLPQPEATPPERTHSARRFRDQH